MFFSCQNVKKRFKSTHMANGVRPVQSVSNAIPSAHNKLIKTYVNIGSVSIQSNCGRVRSKHLQSLRYTYTMKIRYYF